MQNHLLHWKLLFYCHGIFFSGDDHDKEGSFFEKKRTGVQISKNGGDVVFDL
jgi:hypothetical protein